MLARAGVVIVTSWRQWSTRTQSRLDCLHEGLSARDIADALAEAKSVKLSGKHPTALVIGADQTLAQDDGTMLDKPIDPANAKAQLAVMAGKTHKLFSAAVVAERGRPVWRFVATSRMTVRPLSEAFIDSYVEDKLEFDPLLRWLLPNRRRRCAALLADSGEPF